MGPRIVAKTRTAIFGLIAFCCRASGAPAGEPAAGAGPELVLIKAGTRVGDATPGGWTELVLKARPRIESGETDSLPSVAGSSAVLFRSVILADVRPGGGGFVLKRVGIGLCTPLRGVDTVVNGETGSPPPASLGFIAGRVLGAAEAELKKARLVARTETFAVLAAPSELKVGGAHKKVFLVYALLVDPGTGRLDTLLWSIAAEGDRKPAPGSLNRLPPRLVYDCGLDVRADRLFGTLPVNWSFAMRSLPPGRRLVTPERLRPWVADLGRMAENPLDFERALRAEVALGPDPPSPTAR